MLYQITQKLLSLGDDYVIKDSQGRGRYSVDGKVFTIRNACSLQDMNGNELARIHRRLLAIGTTYEIEYQGRTTTVHKKLFTLLRCKFEVDLPGDNDLEAVGNLLDMEYEFRTGRGDTVASVSKRWFSIRDVYGVEIADTLDPVPILAAAIVIDQCCHGDRKH